MTDKNCIEIKTGNIVEITGAFFKSDNGLYYVEHSPGDPGWLGKDLSLRKISKTGKISKAKHNICFWPICVFVSDRSKSAQAKEWNKANATIEVKTIANMSEVVAHFNEAAENLAQEIQRMIWNFGEDNEAVKFRQSIKAHYEAVARAIEG